MKNIVTCFILLFVLAIYIKLAESKNFEINPNENISSISRNTYKDSDLELIFKNTKPIISVTSTGYLTISTIGNKVITYPFSQREITVKVFFLNGLLMVKDQNDMILWNHKFIDKEIKDEVEFLTFINRGTMIVKDNENQRIWPYHEEKLYKKMNLSFSNKTLEISDENKNKIWSFPVDSNLQNDQNFLENIELIRL